VLALLHRPLAYAVRQFVLKDASLGFLVLAGVVRFWPTPWAGNSPKEVLLLHELEGLLELTEGAAFAGAGAVRVAVLDRVAACLGSDHSLVCERALKLWENPKASGCHVIDTSLTRR